MPNDLTVIVPTLNAAAYLPATMAALGYVAEIVVVDGGSTDSTTDVAGNARILTAAKGRGSQLATGIQAATHAWLLLLHADTILSPGWRAALHTDPGKAGYFRFALDSDDPRARRLERLVAWRCRVLGLPYGDQGLLIHKDLLASVGGMSNLPLMEDVDLIRRLGCRRLVALPASATTSAAKWERQGYLRRSARNLGCLALWFAGVPVTWIRRLYG